MWQVFKDPSQNFGPKKDALLGWGNEKSLNIPLNYAKKDNTSISGVWRDPKFHQSQLSVAELKTDTFGNLPNPLLTPAIFPRILFKRSPKSDQKIIQKSLKSQLSFRKLDSCWIYKLFRLAQICEGWDHLSHKCNKNQNLPCWHGVPFSVIFKRIVFLGILGTASSAETI